MFIVYLECTHLDGISHRCRDITMIILTTIIITTITVTTSITTITTIINIISIFQITMTIMLSAGRNSVESAVLDLAKDWWGSPRLSSSLRSLSQHLSPFFLTSS